MLHIYKNRPTFKTKHSHQLPIRAGGLIFYANYMNKIYIMIQEVINKRHYRNKSLPKYIWTDLGGKTDLDDINITDTICREVLEETNLKLFPNKGKYPYNIIPLLNRLKQYLTLHTTHTMYFPESKYQSELVEFNHQQFNPKLFGMIIKSSTNKINTKTNGETNNGETNNGETNNGETNGWKYKKKHKMIKWINIFGNNEHLNNTPRKIGWIELNDFLDTIDKSPNKLHIRLNNEIFIGKIKSLITDKIINEKNKLR